MRARGRSLLYAEFFPFRSFYKKQQLTNHVATYRVKERNYLADQSNNSLSTAKRLYDQQVSRPIIDGPDARTGKTVNILADVAEVFQTAVSPDRVSELGLSRWNNVGPFSRRVLFSDRAAFLLACELPGHPEGPFRRVGNTYYNAGFANALCRNYLLALSIR